MSSISLSNFTIDNAGDILLKNASLIINEGERIALVGQNGVGKTTLLRCISGELDSLEGNVLKEEWAKILFISQDSERSFEGSVLDILAEAEASEKILSLMKRMGFKVGEGLEELDSDFANLSGGEKRILELSMALYSGAYFLLIDEPENHLSMLARQVLIEELKSYWGAVVIVSHDRYMINSVATKICEIEDQVINSFTGCYEDYLEHRERQKLGEIRDWAEKVKKLKRMKAALYVMQRKAKVNTKAAATYRQAKRRYEDLCASIGFPPEVDREAMKIQVREVKRKGGKILAKAEQLTFGYGGVNLLKNVDFTITFGQKIALVGNNGCGKTTLLNLLKGHLEPISGRISLGVNLRVETLAQHNDFGEHEDRSVVAHVMRELTVDETTASSMLANALFDRLEMLAPISKLSGGQKTRLRILVLFAKNPELLILDEPTNNLDLTSWDILVQALDEFNGGVILVSHDREFIESVCDRFFYFDGESVTEWFRDLDSLVEELAHV
jgi:ATP-binding cassette subfamily F protein 3